MTEHPNIKAIRRALRNEGGLYEFEDILEALSNGSMQSFSDGDSFVLTRINNYPRKIVLELILIVGALEDVLAMEPRIEEFAREHNCVAVLGAGRIGWDMFKTKGWRKVFSYYLKELQ